MHIERTPVSTALPFVLTEVMNHCRVTDNASQSELHSMALSAAAEFEAYAAVALMTQTVKVTLDQPPRSCVMPLPFAPVLDPLSVEMTVDGLAFEDFAVITGPRPAIRFTESKPCGLIVIEYQAGFGDSTLDVPRDIRAAINDQVAAFYDIRGSSDGKTNGMSPHMARVAARYRRVAL